MPLSPPSVSSPSTTPTTPGDALRARLLAATDVETLMRTDAPSPSLALAPLGTSVPPELYDSRLAVRRGSALPARRLQRVPVRSDASLPATGRDRGTVVPAVRAVLSRPVWMDDGIADAEYEILDDPVADPPPPVSLDAPTTLVAFVNGQLAHWGVLLDGATWDQIEVAVAAVSAAQQTAGISSALVALRRAYGAAVIEVLPRWRLATGPAPAAWPTLPLAPIPAAGRAR